MKALYYILSFTLIFFTSCEETINIDLNSTNPRLVVDGYVSNLPGPYTIKLTRTANYFDDNNFKPEIGANVTITDNLGNSENLVSDGNGNYKTNTLQGVVGRSYTLKITTADGQNYSAQNTMMDSVRIDSIASVPRNTFAIGQNSRPDDKMVVILFTDPQTANNYYGYKYSLNQDKFFDIIDNRVITDRFSNGKSILITLRNEMKIGDTIYFDLVSFNKQTYDFFNTARRNAQNGSPFSVPPTNPINNISNNAFGFFGTYAITRKKVIVK